MAKAIVYTRSGCPYCVRAVQLFRDLKADFEEVNLDGRPELRAELSARYDWPTVPMVVVGDRFLGGCDDVTALHRRGGLEPLLRG